jgi:hydroxymethylbilane synthase
VVGTSALRRRAQLLHLRPDLRIVNLRGNVDTRLRKLEAGEVEATILASAGLRRLGLTNVGMPIPEDQMLPAVGQGAVCIECRENDRKVRDWLRAINHAATEIAVQAEHAMLAILDGSCRTPIAGHATLDGHGNVHLRGQIARPDGSELISTERRGPAREAQHLGRDAGLELKMKGGPGFFTA